MATDDAPAFPALARLHERHHGLTEAVARYYAEGAAVSLERHHTSPTMVSVSDDANAPRDYLVSWDTPSARQIAAWANRDDATRDGAYGMVIAAAEAHLGLFVIGRADPGSGSDYLFSSQAYNQDADDLLDYDDVEVLRLEISGIDRCNDERHLQARIRAKVYQLHQGDSSLPGIAGVVAFDLARIGFQRA
jgi:hypothetical protein